MKEAMAVTALLRMTLLAATTAELSNNLGRLAMARAFA